MQAIEAGRLEAGEPSMQMQPENTSYASDGPMKTRHITSENSECEYVKKQAASTDRCKQSKQAGWKLVSPQCRCSLRTQAARLMDR